MEREKYNAAGEPLSPAGTVANRINHAMDALKGAQNLRCDGMTLAEATSYGNRITVALSVLNGDTVIDKSTLTMTCERTPEVKA